MSQFNPPGYSLCPFKDEKVKLKKIKPKDMKGFPMPTSDTPIWHDGPPPSIGWWPASSAKNPEYLRWWNGSCWSQPCRKGDPLLMVTFFAARPAAHSSNIQWHLRPANWPAIPSTKRSPSELDEKDWIIIRLMRVIGAKRTSGARDSKDYIKTALWLEKNTQILESSFNEALYQLTTEDPPWTSPT
jgi:hypothetical protein